MTKILTEAENRVVVDLDCLQIVDGDPSLNQAVGLQVAMAAAIVMAGMLGNAQTNNNTSQPTLGTDLLTHHLAKIPQSQLTEVLTELKAMATQNKEQACQLLIAHPQLLKAVLQAHIMLKSVPPLMLQMPSARQLPGPHVHPLVQGGPLAQPSSLQALPRLPPLAQTKLQLVSVPNQYAAPSVPMQPPFQTPLPAQHQVLPHSTFSVPPVPGNLQSLHPQPPVRLSNRLENQMESSSSTLQYPGQNVLNPGHQTSQLVAPIQPSIPTHKKSEENCFNEQVDLVEAPTLPASFRWLTKLQERDFKVFLVDRMK